MRAKALTLSLIYLLLLGSVLPAGEKRRTNFWQNLFTEPSEILYAIMKDGIPLKISSHEENTISGNILWFKQLLKRFNADKEYEIKDIAIVIHDHPLIAKFSDSDKYMHRLLKRHGFNGLFLLYCRRTKKTYDIEDEIK